MGIVGASVLALAIGDVVFGEAAYLVFYVVAAIVLGVQVILQRRERARRVQRNLREWLEDAKHD